MHTVSRLFGPTTKIKDIKGQAKVKQRTEKTRKHCHCCHGLLIFVKTPKTLFTLNNWYLSRSKSGTLLGQRAFTYHGYLVQ